MYKGLQQLKVGGKLSYSTCSLNPIENESVVASALKQFPGMIELVSVKLDGFKFREGLTTWKVMVEAKEPVSGSFFTEFPTFSSVPEDIVKSKGIKDTMFADYYEPEIRQELKKCLRVFPHDQNTSGFFITIIRKLKDFDDYTVQGTEETKQSHVLPAMPKFEMKTKTPLPLLIQKKN